MIPEKIARINELARLAKERELTADQTAEREVLRREYRESVTGNMRAQLENTYIVDSRGNKTKLNKKS